jgi:hypothetical protein
MFTALRKSTVILLAILQLIAPLVHAHAGEKASELGLHVPGLEIYSIQQDTFISQAVNHDENAAHTASQRVAAFSSSPSIEGIIVSVDAGIRDKPVNAVVDVDNDHYLYQQNALFKTAIPSFDVNFPPQVTRFVSRLLIPSLSPRAPPAQ